ncbi:hypothetical protein A5784_12815 [Mycobacterium sp. 852013-50091_SCH5140682]|nr:hypothetical protein A5784_12815 [Mycobacterium sp. 852013-50091_SCH5140682]
MVFVPLDCRDIGPRHIELAFSFSIGSHEFLDVNRFFADEFVRRTWGGRPLFELATETKKVVGTITVDFNYMV